VAGLVLPNVMQVGKAVLEATVSDPVAQPRLDASLAVSDVSGGVVHGASGRLAAAGRLSALAVTATADAPSLAGAAARLISTATINAQTRSLTLNRLEAVWKGQTLRLLAPARIDVADGVAIDSLRLGYRQAVLTLSGRAPSAPASGTATKTALDLTATLRDLPIDSAAIVDPALAADGHIEGDLRLTGSVERPEGRLALTASGVHLRQGPGQGLPPARVATTVTFHGDAAAVDARMTAGKTHLSATGSVPLNDTEPMTIRADGQIDLLMLDPLIAADGRRARGSAVLDARIGGSLAQPVVTGSLALRDGDIVDYSLGGHIADLAGLIEAEGNTIRIVRLTGRAGAGTMGVTGTVGLGGTMPVDLHVTADDAKPLSSDLLSATIDQDLTLRGDIKGHLEIGGSVHVRRADIRIPDTLPPSIAVLPVRLPGAAPPPPAPFHGAIALNLTLDAPQRVFVRGRGLDAELGGTMQIRGTVEQPQPDGGLHLRHGTVSIIGTTLTFTDGSVSFSGAGIADPTLFFVATSTNAAMTARLTVSGTAKNPEIALSSTPALPQDEVLAELLFNTSAAKLSPLQLAQVASALASLSGATAGFDPLNTMRTALGLDRLSVGSNAAGSPTLEAGRYVAPDIYVGVKQGTSGGGPQATVQIEVAKGLRVDATAGGAQTSATGASSSTEAASIGVSYQFEY